MIDYILFELTDPPFVSFFLNALRGQASTLALTLALVELVVPPHVRRVGASPAKTSAIIGLHRQTNAIPPT